MKRIAGVGAVLVLALVMVGCGGDDDDDDGGSASSSGTTISVTAENTKFSPTTLTGKDGEKVTFELDNKDDIEHNLTIEDLDVDKDVEGGETGKATATLKAGTFTFFCEYHPQQMRGTLTVS